MKKKDLEENARKNEANDFYNKDIVDCRMHYYINSICIQGFEINIM